MNPRKDRIRRLRRLLRPATWFVLLSLFVHTAVLVFLEKAERPVRLAGKPVKIRIIPKKKKPQQQAAKDDAKIIVETPQTKTLPPEKAKYLGPQDHRTAEERRHACEFRQKVLTQARRV